MPDVGEELVGAYLRVIRGCPFVQYNVPTYEKQAEIDVIGINLEEKKIYICEVATHLGGLSYVNKKAESDNVLRLTKKFKSGMEYAKKLEGYKPHFMFWSPVVKYSADTAKKNQFRDLAQIQNAVDFDIEMVVNEVYQNYLNELRSKASTHTPNSEFRVFRVLQIIEQLDLHVGKLKKKISNSTDYIKQLAANSSNNSLSSAFLDSNEYDEEPESPLDS